MSLTSASTFDDAIGQLNDNLSWEGSPSKASAALEAVRWLLFNRARVSMRQGSQLQFEDLAALEKRLGEYVGATGATALVKRTAFVRGMPL